MEGGSFELDADEYGDEWVGLFSDMLHEDVDDPLRADSRAE